MKSEQRLGVPSPEVRHALLRRDLMLQFEAIAGKDGKLDMASIREVWRHRARAQNLDVRGISIARLLRYWTGWTRADHRFGLVRARPSETTRSQRHR